MLFQKEYIITSHDTDSKNIIKPSALVRYLQDTASSQMKEEKPSYEDLFAQNLAFIIAKISVNIYTDLQKYDKILVSSWPCNSTGIISTRCYRVLCNNKVAVEAISNWALVNTQTKKLTKLDTIKDTYTYSEQLNCYNPRFIIPKDEMKTVSEYEVTYSNIDINHHMNNTVYHNIFYDRIPDIEKKKVVHFCVNYKKEIVLADKVEIQISEPHYNDDETISYYFNAVKDGISCTQAFFKVK